MMLSTRRWRCMPSPPCQSSARTGDELHDGSGGERATSRRVTSMTCGFSVRLSTVPMDASARACSPPGVRVTVSRKARHLLCVKTMRAQPLMILPIDDAPLVQAAGTHHGLDGTSRRGWCKLPEPPSSTMSARVLAHVRAVPLPLMILHTDGTPVSLASCGTLLCSSMPLSPDSEILPLNAFLTPS